MQDNPLAGLLVRFRADSSEFQAAVAGIRTDIDDFFIASGQTLQHMEGMFVDFGAAVAAAGRGAAMVFQQAEGVVKAAMGAAAEIGGAIIAIKAYSAAVAASASAGGTAVNAYRALRIALSPTMFTVATVAAGALAVAAAEAAYKLGGMVQEQGELAASTKLSTDVIEELTATAKASGAGLGSLVSGVEAVNKELGSEAGRKAIETLGVAVENTFGQTRQANVVFEDLARKIGAIEDPTKRAEAAFLIFGDTLGSKLLPTLNQLSSIQQENARRSEIMSSKNRIALSNLKDDVDLLAKFLPMAGSMWASWWDSLVQAAGVGVAKINQFLREEDEELAKFMKGLGKLQSGPMGGAIIDDSGAQAAAKNAQIMGDAYKKMHASQMELVGSAGLAVIASGKFNGQIKESTPAVESLAGNFEALIHKGLLDKFASDMKKSAKAVAEFLSAGDANGKKLAYAPAEIEYATYGIQLLTQALLDAASSMTKIKDLRMPEGFQSMIEPIKSVEDLMHSIGENSQAELQKMADAARAVYDQLVLLQQAGITTDTEVSKAFQHWSKLEDEAANVVKSTSVTVGSSLGEFQKTANRVFSDLSNGIANVITGGGKMSDVFLKVAKDIEASIIKYLIQGAFKALAKALGDLMANMTGILGQIGKILTQVGGGAASTAGSAAGTAAGGAASAAGGIAGGLSGALASWIGVGVAAAAGIVSGIQQAHANNLLDQIEKSTRYTKIYTGEQSQSILWSTQTTAERLNYVNGSLDLMKTDLHWAVVPILQEILDNMRQGVKTIQVTAVGNDPRKQAQDLVRQLKLQGVTA